MKQKQFDKRNLKASKSLNRFDLSNRTILTAAFGALLPCMVRHVIGGSKVRLELEHQIRVNALKSPAFSRMRQHFDYFFVPYSQLYRFYDNFKTQQSNYNSALFEGQNNKTPTSLPFFTGQDMSDMLADWGTDQQIDDVNGFDIRYGHRRLFDLLRYGNIPMEGMLQDYPYLNDNIRLNPFAALAYQKIYYDYYRNDKYEDNDSEAYNIDDIKNGVQIHVDRLRKIFQLRYRWRRKDYFTQVTPDVLPLSNAFGRAGMSNNLVVQGADEINASDAAWSQFSLPVQSPLSSKFPVTNGVVNPDDHGDGEDLLTQTAGANVRMSTNVSEFNTLANIPRITNSVSQHRLATARQKLLERMYAAHSDFSSQMMAIFGYSPAESRFGNVSHIGGFSDIIQIADVDNTTPDRNTADAVFGKINNVNSHERYLDYEIPEDGVLMCIFSTDILQDYDSFRLDRFNFKNVPEDFFQPFYEGLGKQTLLSIEYATIAYDPENGDYVPTLPAVIGFVPRYSEYKSQIDEVHGEFCKWGSKEYMCAPTNLDYDRTHPYLYHKNLILNPKQLDPIMPVGYNGKEANDQFELNLYHSVKVLAPMQKMREY